MTSLIDQTRRSLEHIDGCGASGSESMPREVVYSMGRLPTQLGYDRADAVFKELKNLHGGPWAAKLAQVAVLWVDVEGSRDLLIKVKERFFSLLMTTLYEVTRTTVLDKYGVVVNFVGDGVLAIFTKSEDINGDTIANLQIPAVRAVLAANVLAKALSEKINKLIVELLTPGTDLSQMRVIHEVGVKKFELSARIGLAIGSALIGTFGPQAGRKRTPLPLDLLALGEALILGYEVCACASENNAREQYNRSQALACCDSVAEVQESIDVGWNVGMPGCLGGLSFYALKREAKRFVEEYGKYRVDSKQKSTVLVHDKVRELVKDSPEVQAECDFVQLPWPLPLKRLGDHYLWIMVGKQQGDRKTENDKESQCM